MEKPRRKATRFGEHDYSRAGRYFVTVCAENRRSAFGEIVNEEMRLSAVGAVAQECWRLIPNHFPSADIGEFIVMPNHIHGIVIVGDADCRGRDACMRGTRLPRRPPQSENQNANRSKMSLSKIMQGFKSAVTRTVGKRRNDHAFGWQRSFYDRVIRDDAELNRIREYIRDNPSKWAFDRYNPENRP